MKPQTQNHSTTQNNECSNYLGKLRNPKIMGNFYIAGVVAFILFLYVTNVLLAWIIKMPLDIGKVIYLLVIHSSLFLFSWCFIRTIKTDPGRVPLHWGFYLDDPEHKKRRYCLVCHIFKPERCHHCSICNRCVLNMDHHCPWINNCVGFYNRKFFILMLFYVVLSTFIIICGQIKVISFIAEETIEYFDNENIEINWLLNFLIVIGFIGDLAIFCVMICFFKFHCTLIYSNMTTIEHLDSKRNNAQATTTNYDIGFWYNFYQIFGKNWVLWFFPVFLESGKPVGDGVVWLQRHKESMNENMENGSEIDSIKKSTGFQTEMKKEEKIKKANLQNIANQNFPTFVHSDFKKFQSNENNKNNININDKNNNGFDKNMTHNNNMMGFQENMNYQNNNYLSNSYHSPTNQNQALIDVNPPKRMLLPAENTILDERHSHNLYSEFKPIETSFNSKTYEKAENIVGNVNFNSPYGLTGYSQPNPMSYKAYEHDNNKDFTDYKKNQSVIEKYGYNRFDVKN